MKTRRDVVIGGGLGGLACAALLARAGRAVTLLEKAPEVGGRAASQEEGQGWLNLGPHALYRGGRGRPVLAELGVEPAGSAPRGSGSLALDRGEVHALPVGLVSMMTTGLLTLGEKLEMGRALQALPSIDPASLRGRSVASWIESIASRPGTRAVLLALVRVATYGNAPELASAEAAVRQLQLAASSGVTYVDGGWQKIADALLERARAAGVEVRLSTRAESVVPGEVRLAGGEVIAADAVVVAATPSVAASLVPGSAAIARAAGEAVPVRAACLDLVLSGLPRPRVRFCLGIDEPLYYSLHSATARLAPEGVHVIHAARYLAPGETADASTLEAMMDRLQPGWQNLVVARRFLPQLVVAGDLHAADRPRQGPVVEDAPGVFVVGDWVGDGAMLADASLASAQAAAARILERRADARPRAAAASTEAMAWG